jgi:tetratricopeptide (TPR) repeat protein
MEHYAALLLLEPTDADARKQLRQLAERSGAHDRHAAALLAAAESNGDPAVQATLLVDAAFLYRTVLDDRDRAIELYSRVLDAPDAERFVALNVAHNLNELLADAGRAEERLAVLEKLSTLERTNSVRRSILGEAARLADELGDSARALAAYNAVLEINENDLAALDALVDLLNRAQQYDELISALHRRAAAPVRSQQRRADLVWIAKLQTEQLQDDSAAMETWLRVSEDFGDDEEVTTALDDLLGSASRWSELAELLERAAAGQRTRASSLLSRLGEIHRLELDQPERATEFHSQAIALNASEETCRAGLRSLLEVPACAEEAAEALARACSETNDWELLLEILEPRLGVQTNARSRVRILREAAELYEERADNPAAAVRVLAVAFAEDPTDTTIEQELMRLAESSGNWKSAAAAYGEAAGALRGHPSRAAQLRFTQGHILERHLNDPAAAVDAYTAVLDDLPTHAETPSALVRVASQSQAWDVAGRAAIMSARNSDSLGAHVVDQLERTVADARAWDPFVDAMTAAVAARDDLPPVLATAIETQIATWHLQRRDDRQAAEAAAQRALSHSATDRETLLLLANLQRPTPGPQLVDTLLRLDALTADDLDMLREAAAVASQSAESTSTAESILERLYRKASGMWMRAEQTRGKHEPEETTAWALERLVEACAAAGNSERAVRFLVDGAQLPFEPSIANALRQRAADALLQHGETERAIDLYRTVLDATPSDLDATQRLAALCTEPERLPELVALRRRELSVVEDKERQLELRLEIAEHIGVLEERGGRVELLLRNLDEEPGHPTSVEALSKILDARGHYQELAAVLSDQAVRLLNDGQTERSCDLWTRVARVAENNLKDVDGAILAYGQVVEHAATNQALDALARLHLERGEPAEAAAWLQRRLETADAKQRVAILLKLARAQIRADQPDAAIAPLEAAFEEAPRNGEVRKLLMRLYRQAEMWEPLAHALTTATDHINDNDTILAYAREAGELYSEKLGKPELAVAALEKGHSIAPEDRRLRAMLAEGLRAEGRVDEARVLLEGLIEDFGRRRSAERAQAHLALARVMHAQEDNEAAIDQLEIAYKMDAGNVRIVRALAELARDCREYKRAEAAYRALLLIVRRGQADAEAEPIGASEILLELSRIARERGQEGQAEELLESALEALSQNDDEAPQLQATLIARDELDLLRRVLETRLDSVQSTKRRADVLADLGDLLEKRLDRPEEAFDARLQAVENDPGSPPRHASARDLATSLDALDRYAELVERQLEKAQRDTDAHVRCELLLRLGEIMETHRDDLDRASELYGEAESTGVREVDVWRACARVAGARGDTEEQMRLLGQLASLGEDEAGAESRVDALYRLAEVQLASSETATEGIASLSKALEEDPRYERAGVILGRATQEETTDDDLLALYEQVARKSGDDRMVLQYLERRTAHPTARPEHAREAVDVALTLDEKERAESLMLRAVEIGQDALDGLESVAWAMLGLAENCKQAGDLAGAVKWLGEAAEVAEPGRLFQLGREVADLAATPDGDLTLAAKLYERLLERDPTAREAWEPLVEIHRKLGNHEALDRLVEETLDGLQDPGDRNWLRLQRATMLLDIESRREDAIDVLREILMEDPEHHEATELLVVCFSESGNEEDLLELLSNGLMAAQSRNEPDAIAAASLRLGRHVEKTAPEEAVAVYRSALESAPANRELLQAVLNHTDIVEEPQEAAEIMERLLAVETGERAAELTKELVAMYESQEDEEGILRALKLGFQRSPGDEDLRQRLEETYRARGDHTGVAQLLLGVAQTMEDPEARLATIREAAAIHRDTLSDPAAAVEILRQAADSAPDDISLSFELATTLSAAGDHDEAIARISHVLEAAQEDEALRLDALRLRAKMRRATGDEHAARADLEEAYKLDALAVAPELEEILRRQRSLSAADGDRDLERAITLRLVEILLVQSQSELARDLLEQWVEQEPKDVEFLHMLRDIDTNDQRWEALARTCTRLISIAEGEAQVDAGLRLAYACEQAGRPENARKGLEKVLKSQPDNSDIRTELRQVYERAGEHAKLAKLLLEDAEAIEKESTRISLLRRAAELLLSAGKADAAIPVYTKILELEPGDHATVVALADSHIAAGELDQADTMIDDAITARRGRRSPELAILQQRKAAVARARGNDKQRLNWLEQAFACDKNNGHVVAEVAELAEQLEKWDLAVKALRTLALMETDSPMSRGQAFLRQGRIALRKGDRKRAVLWARKARQEEPDLDEIAAFMAELGER